MLVQDIAEIKDGKIIMKDGRTVDQIYKGFQLYRSGAATKLIPSEFTAIKESEQYQGPLEDVKRQIDKYWEKKDAEELVGKTKDGKYKIYFVNHNYYSGEEFDDIEEARKYAKSKGFDYRIDLNGKPVESGGIISGTRIYKDSKISDANPDGTISPDEDRRRKEIVERAQKMRSDLKREAYQIGGNFRGPGIWSEVKKVLSMDSTCNSGSVFDSLDPDETHDVRDIEKETIANNYFRKVLFTSERLQLVIMSLKPGEDIGEEVHPTTDQFIRIEEGKAKAIVMVRK